MNNVGKRIVQAQFDLPGAVPSVTVRFFDEANVFKHVIGLHTAISGQHTKKLAASRGLGGQKLEQALESLGATYAQQSVLADLARVLLPDFLATIIDKSQPVALQLSDYSFSVATGEQRAALLQSARAAKHTGSMYLFESSGLLTPFLELVEIGHIV